MDARSRWVRYLESLPETPQRLAVLRRFPGRHVRLARLLAEGLRPAEAAERLAALAGEGSAEDWARAQRDAAADLAYLARRGAALLGPGDPGWPRALSALREPPVLLSVLGRLPEGPCLGIVGTRSATPEGSDAAARVAAAWAGRGGWVVSGGAEGIDAAAHRGCLAAGRPTVVVLGTGLAHPYPASNLGLFARVAGLGALISELPPGFEGQRWTFLRRNRIVAALASALVVVQAGSRSGALSTARFALQSGRKVFTVPGPAEDPRWAGHALLLAQGARPLEPPEAIAGLADGTGATAGVRPVGAAAGRGPPPRCPQQRRLLALFGRDVRHVDELRAASGLDMGELCAALLALEACGLVAEVEGNRYRRL